MSRFKQFLALAVISLFILSGCPAQQPKQTKEPEEQAPEKPKVTANSVVAEKADKAPVIDGVDEGVWEKAEAKTVELTGGGALQGSGGNFDNGKTTVKVKALYDNENIYLQYVWSDPTETLARGPWVLEGGKLVKKGYNEFYEDKLATLWNINNSVADFNEKGCSVTCHSTEFKDEKTGKTIIKHWTNGDNERIDMWHWKVTRQNTLYGPDKPGIMHDQFMDNVKFDPENKDTKGGGRHSDPGEKEYVNNATGESPDWGEPKLVFDGSPVNGNKYVIVENLDKTKPFTADYTKTMKEGDTIPGPIAKQITGDPADIQAKGKYANGTWTLETKRKLTTGSDKDIQFSDLAKEYFFAVSAFDNSQIGHAYQSGAQKLVFKK